MLEQILLELRKESYLLYEINNISLLKPSKSSKKINVSLYNINGDKILEFQLRKISKELGRKIKGGT